MYVLSYFPLLVQEFGMYHKNGDSFKTSYMVILRKCHNAVINKVQLLYTYILCYYSTLMHQNFNLSINGSHRQNFYQVANCLLIRINMYIHTKVDSCKTSWSVDWPQYVHYGFLTTSNLLINWDELEWSIPNVTVISN